MIANYRNFALCSHELSNGRWDAYANSYANGEWVHIDNTTETCAEAMRALQAAIDRLCDAQSRPIDNS